MLIQVHLEQIPKNNELILWQEFKHEFGGKLLSFNTHCEKSYCSRRNNKAHNCSWIRLFIAALIVEMLLIMSGDVELNPGPLQGRTA